MLLFDSFVGKMHLMVTKINDEVILRIGEYDQEYKSKKKAQFRFTYDEAFKVCDYFYMVQKTIRNLREQSRGLDGFNVREKKIGNNNFIRFSLSKTILQQVIGMKI